MDSYIERGSSYQNYDHSRHLSKPELMNKFQHHLRKLKNSSRCSGISSLKDIPRYQPNPDFIPGVSHNPVLETAIESGIGILPSLSSLHSNFHGAPRSCCRKYCSSPEVPYRPQTYETQPHCGRNQSSSSCGHCLYSPSVTSLPRVPSSAFGNGDRVTKYDSQSRPSTAGSDDSQNLYRSQSANSYSLGSSDRCKPTTANKYCRENNNSEDIDDKRSNGFVSGANCNEPVKENFRRTRFLKPNYRSQPPEERPKRFRYNGNRLKSRANDCSEDNETYEKAERDEEGKKQEIKTNEYGTSNNSSVSENFRNGDHKDSSSEKGYGNNDENGERNKNTCSDEVKNLNNSAPTRHQTRLCFRRKKPGWKPPVLPTREPEPEPRRLARSVSKFTEKREPSVSGFDRSKSDSFDYISREIYPSSRKSSLSKILSGQSLCNSFNRLNEQRRSDTSRPLSRATDFDYALGYIPARSIDTYNYLCSYGKPLAEPKSSVNPIVNLASAPSAYSYPHSGTNNDIPREENNHPQSDRPPFDAQTTYSVSYQPNGLFNAPKMDPSYNLLGPSRRKVRSPLNTWERVFPTAKGNNNEHLPPINGKRPSSEHNMINRNDKNMGPLRNSFPFDNNIQNSCNNQVDANMGNQAGWETIPLQMNRSNGMICNPSGRNLHIRLPQIQNRYGVHNHSTQSFSNKREVNTNLNAQNSYGIDRHGSLRLIKGGEATPKRYPILKTDLHMEHASKLKNAAQSPCNNGQRRRVSILPSPHLPLTPNNRYGCSRQNRCISIHPNIRHSPHPGYASPNARFSGCAFRSHLRSPRFGYSTSCQQKRYNSHAGGMMPQNHCNNYHANVPQFFY